MKTNPASSKLTNFLLIIISVLLFSCSKEKDTLTARVYHSTTSYFNGYYNANEVYQGVRERLEKGYSYPEQGFMQVVYYGTEQEMEGVKSDLQTVVEKNDAVMFKHPNGSYIDECRLLNGKSWFYQQNYDRAFKNLQAVIDSFPRSRSAAEAWFWIAQTHYRMDNKQLARDVVQENVVNNDTLEFTDEMTGELGLFLTRLEIEDEDYDRAVKLLEAYLPYVKGKLRMARAHYLMGQLYAKIDAFPKALEQFELVPKYSPSYDLTFSSKMKIARLFVQFQKGPNNDEGVRKYLTKLLKDEKNRDYADQIYYEFALLELKNENRPAAIDYLNLSIRANTTNQRQKALSYYKIGQIYFYDLIDYDKAQAYYDSAASSIIPEAPEYDEITRIASTLREYIGYKRTIQFQDSMLYLSSLPEEELDALIDKLYEEEEARKRAEAERLLAQQNDPAFNPLLQNGFGNQQQGGAQWYFGNPGAVSQGRIQFEQKWGTRKNEDNWRRKNKQIVFGESREQEIQDAKKEPVDSTLLEAYGDKYDYYKDIPRTDDEIAAANDKIEDALFRLGQLYSQKLEEPDSAVKTFEELINRYGDSDFALQARYALYQIYFSKKDPRFNPHKNYILENHPNTVYAYLILGKDPKELERDERDFIFVYTGLFEAYARGEYETCIGFSGYLLEQVRFTDNPEIELSDLLFIRGMSYGFMGEEDSLRLLLTKVVNEFPQADVTPRAEQTLNYILNGVPEPEQVSEATGQTEAPTVSEDDPRFKGLTKAVKANEKVYILIYIPKDQASKNDLQTAISDFNKEFHAEKKLRVNVFLYQNAFWLPYIGSFKNVDATLGYIRGVLNYPKVRDQIQGKGEIFYISHSNFRVAYSQQRMEDYLLYYKEILSKQ